MIGTVLTLLIMLGLLIVCLGCNSLAVFGGARWAKLTSAKLSQAVSASVALVVANGLLSWAIRSLSSGESFAVIIQLIVDWFILSKWFSASFRQTLQIWLATLPVSFLALVATTLVVRPYLCEAFVSPSNGMSPTILGSHRVGVCPRCGAPAFGSSSEGMLDRSGDLLAMCSQELRPVEVAEFTSANGPRDRFLVSKFLKPRRWDLLVFRYPARPEQAFVMRLVGLPGERVHLAEGSVWIDGQRISPPAQLDGMQFSTELEGGFTLPVHGTAANPAQLGDDEYFVLGDFHLRSLDSRIWSTGAAGHPPFAVPADHIIGVVTTIYWPPSRWRSLR